MDCEIPSLSKYKRGTCRCDACRALNITYMREYHKTRIITGQMLLVPADRARRHLLWLKSEGMTFRRAAVLAGLSVSAMHTCRIAHGQTQRIRRETEHALLAIRP